MTCSLMLLGFYIFFQHRHEKCKNDRVILIGESIGNLPAQYNSKAYFGIRLKYQGRTYTTQTLTNILDRKYVLISVCKFDPNVVSLILDYNIDSCAENIVVPNTGWDEIPNEIKKCGHSNKR